MAAIKSNGDKKVKIDGNFDDVFSEGEQITGKELVGMLKQCDLSKEVYFARLECGYHPETDFPVNEMCSWRGSYDSPTICTSGDVVHTTGDLLGLLDDFFGSEQTGYKGGQFTMLETDPLWADGSGIYNRSGVCGVIESDERVFIITDSFDY